MNCERIRFTRNYISTKFYAVPGKLFTVSIPEEQIGKVQVTYLFVLCLVSMCVSFYFIAYYFVFLKNYPLKFLFDIS